MSVSERRDLIIFKDLHSEFVIEKLELSNRVSSRKIPLVKVYPFKSATFKRSLEYRSVKLWNSLPKDTDVKNISRTKFLDIVKLLLTK